MIADAKNAIRKTAFKEADTLLINADDYTNILKHPDFRQHQLSGIFVQQNLVEGSIGRIQGLDIMVHNIVKDINPGKPRGTEAGTYPGQPGVIGTDVEQMLNNRAIIMKRGSEMGFMGIAEGFQTDMYPVRRRRAVELQAWEAFGPAIVRPNHLIHLKTDGSA